MKKLTYVTAFTFILLGIFHSCQNNDDLIDEPNATSNTSFKWDDVYRYNFDSNEDGDLPVDILPKSGDNRTRGHDVLIGDVKVYPTQNIVHSQFRQFGKWNEVACKVNPHYLVFDFTPVPYVAEISKPLGPVSYAVALGQAMESPEWERSSASAMKGRAEASFKDVKTYEDFKLSFGANVSVGLFASANMSYTHNSTKYKTTFIARFKSTSFDVFSYLDGKVTNDRLVWDSQSYVSSLTYGKTSYLVIFSNYTYDEVKTTINTTFAASIVSGGGNYSKETLQILSSSESYAYVIGNDINQTFFGNTPEFLNKLFSTTFDKNTIGVPIFFQLRSTKNNQLIDAEKGYGWIENPIVYIEL